MTSTQLSGSKSSKPLDQSAAAQTDDADLVAGVEHRAALLKLPNHLSLAMNSRFRMKSSKNLTLKGC
jgi:hypothetical protein